MFIVPVQKKSTEKKTPWERLPKVYACSDIDLGELLFHDVMLCDKENRSLSSKIYRVSFDGILLNCLLVKKRNS